MKINVLYYDALKNFLAEYIYIEKILFFIDNAQTISQKYLTHKNKKRTINYSKLLLI